MRHLWLYTPYLLFFLGVIKPIHAQNIHLDINAQNEVADSVIGQLGMPKTFPDLLSLKEGLQQLRDTLMQKGYIDYALSSLIKKNDTLYIGQLNLGRSIRTLHLHTTDDLVQSYAEKLDLVSTDGFITVAPDELPETLERFVKLEAESGYPLTVFKLIRIRQNDDELFADLQIQRETQRTIDKVVVKGYEKYPRSFVKNYGGFRQKKTYKEGQIIKKADQLRQLSFFSSSRKPEVLFTEDSTSVFLYLEKKPANRFDGFIGFGTDERTGRFRLDGNLDLALINNLNFGESFKVNYKSDGNDQQNLQIAANMPFLFGSPLGAELTLNLFRQDSTFSTSRQTAEFSYLLGPRSQVYTRVTFERSTNLLESPPSASITPEDYKKTLFGLGYRLESRTAQRLLNTPNHLSIYFSYGQRRNPQVDTEQLSLEFETAYNFRIANTQQFYIANTTKNLNTANYFVNELFRFGGNKSIRGFAENALAADLFSVFRTEYRYIPTTNFYAHTIFDACYYENDIQRKTGYLYSFGLGAGILTNAGLLNFSLANGLQQDQDFKFSNMIIHFQFTTFF